MKFEFQHSGEYQYIFYRHEEDWDYDDDESTQHTYEYVLNVDAYTVEAGPQYEDPDTIYALPKNMELSTHDSVFQFMYNLAYNHGTLGYLPTMDTVLKDGLKDAQLIGDTLNFGDEWQVRISSIGNHEATVQYIRWDTLVYRKDVPYVGRRLAANVWAALFPERFKLNEAEERALAIAELENEVQAARIKLEQKAEELERLQRGEA